MALIKCPNCGKDISDKAPVCPGCGVELLTAESKPEVAINLVCEECSIEYPSDLERCPNCGNPTPVTAKEENPQKVEVAGVSISDTSKRKLRKIGLICTIIAVTVLAIIIGVFVWNQHRIAEEKAAYEERVANYQENLGAATDTMLLGAVQAENAGNLIKSVWYNAIYEEYDPTTNEYTRPDGYYVGFNTALSNLFADADFAKQVSSIKENQETAAQFMKELSNPPDEFSDAHDAIKDYYDSYLTLTNLATDPTGSLQTFSSSFNEADTATVNAYKKMDMYID